MCVCVQGLEKNMGYLVGDCLLAAAFLSYMGPFLSHYRDDLVSNIWMKKVSCSSLSITFRSYLYMYKGYWIFTVCVSGWR